MSSSTKSPDEGGSPVVATPGSYYGNPIPYLPIDGYPGKIIAVEGTDGVGRSTQITLLREWLEVQGYGVIETGWTRSELMQPTIELAKSSNTLNKLTFVLLYATDFADRLEKEIIPALKAGFIVLSDRYIFTAMARARERPEAEAQLRLSLQATLEQETQALLRSPQHGVLAGVLELSGQVERGPIGATRRRRARRNVDQTHPARSVQRGRGGQALRRRPRRDRTASGDQRQPVLRHRGAG